jgi:bifunctional DNA-binding transcriptional regulator/antitoxin component of YhaV-PrlF toxin-antitoxin module
MIVSVSAENMVAIPAEIGCRLGIRPGDRIDWEAVEGTDAALVREIVDRGELARRLCGLGASLAPDRDRVAELDAEREREDQEPFRSFDQ